MRVAPYLTLGIAAILVAGCGASSDKSAEVAKVIGANSCTDSGWYITAGDAKQTVYDCWLPSKHYSASGLDRKCVIYVGGVARDVTDSAKFDLQNALSKDRPACAT